MEAGRRCAGQGAGDRREIKPLPGQGCRRRALYDAAALAGRMQPVRYSPYLRTPDALGRNDEAIGAYDPSAARRTCAPSTLGLSGSATKRAGTMSP